MKLGMWVVLGTSVTHVVCRHQMCILITSFAYLFWLANNNKVKYSEFYMGESDETWNVGSNALKYVDAHIKYLICVFPQKRPTLYILWI